jgi:hypothetical protein
MKLILQEMSICFLVFVKVHIYKSLYVVLMLLAKIFFLNIYIM